ncbi:ribosomal RNA processing protein 36 homolog [Rhinatrema bivittatum]|uniref:ribosomal RNA processing protein 36 homolog n=1 Tax=Rhinatrema bivittatum TaxID=194408 RepID=UPI00112965CB|nr:ribosomal RNA processing protein 36 homolog [Rhinatrema bivittatum]
MGTDASVAIRPKKGTTERPEGGAVECSDACTDKEGQSNESLQNVTELQESLKRDAMEAPARGMTEEPRPGITEEACKHTELRKAYETTVADLEAQLVDVTRKQENSYDKEATKTWDLEITNIEIQVHAQEELDTIRLKGTALASTRELEQHLQATVNEFRQQLMEQEKRCRVSQEAVKEKQWENERLQPEMLSIRQQEQYLLFVPWMQELSKTLQQQLQEEKAAQMNLMSQDKKSELFEDLPLKEALERDNTASQSRLRTLNESYTLPARKGSFNRN